MSQENMEIVRAGFEAWHARPGEPDLGADVGEGGDEVVGVAAEGGLHVPLGVAPRGADV